MDYNPFTDEYEEYKKNIERLSDSQKILDKELAWFESTDIHKLNHALENKMQEKVGLAQALKTCQLELKKITSELTHVENDIGSDYNPFNWFDSQQSTLKASRAALRLTQTQKQQNVTRAKSSFVSAETAINEYSANIDRYKRFDRNQTCSEMQNLSDRLFLIKKEFEVVSKRKTELDEKLHPIVEDIKSIKSKIKAKEEIKSRAEKFQDRLADAKNNKRDRAIIHQECDRSLGDGKPENIIKSASNELRPLKNDLDKLEKRAKSVVERASRNIKKIVIDGNNMCYEGSIFVGLKPLIALTNQLCKSYQTVLVFDAAIRSQLRLNNDELKKNFSEKISIHIVATKQKADETILGLAENDRNCYVLSNDRFGEYGEKEASHRVIRHEVVDGKVMVHDLDINEKYN